MVENMKLYPFAFVFTINSTGFCHGDSHKRYQWLIDSCFVFDCLGLKIMGIEQLSAVCVELNFIKWFVMGDLLFSIWLTKANIRSPLITLIKETLCITLKNNCKCQLNRGYKHIMLRCFFLFMLNTLQGFAGLYCQHGYEYLLAKPVLRMVRMV